MGDLIPALIFLVIPGLAAGIMVVLTRRLSAQVFWSLLVAVLALFTAISAVRQVGKEAMNGPLATALAFILPTAISLSTGRLVKKWPVAATLTSLASYAVTFAFGLSYGLGAHWLGLPFP